jgi:hypothetical protein
MRRGRKVERRVHRHRREHSHDADHSQAVAAARRDGDRGPAIAFADEQGERRLLTIPDEELRTQEYEEGRVELEAVARAVDVAFRLA